MRGVNKTITVGTLGADPDVKQFPNGGSITTISVAVSEQWNDKQTGERKENTEWLRIVFNNKLAEIAGQWLKKGSKVYIEGKLKTRKYQDNTGQDRYVTEIQAFELQMLGDNPNNGQQGNNQQNNVTYQRQPQGNFQQPQGQQYAQNAMANAPQPNYQQQPFNNNMQGGMPQAGYADTSDVPF